VNASDLGVTKQLKLRQQLSKLFAPKQLVGKAGEAGKQQL
jgi:hypothetical protein